MPRTKAQGMTRIELYVPTALFEEAEELSDFEGWKLAELHRVFWENGFGAYVERSNKRMINKRLRGKISPDTTNQGEE
ncbi:hypothetical protein [Nostoc sp. WHI]|uniref:hypothetical protein n=1 Tax=Nostoc sp. WHI TaxID=2650611 RepID=UPI001E650E45|nr:hypothetical protein [Nostoc sp. WHI]